MGSAASFASMFNITCAVGVVNDKSSELDSFEIVGSGILIQSDAIVTNRHVADALGQRERQRACHKVAQFCMLKDKGHIEITFCFLEKGGLIMLNPAADLAFF